MDAFEADAPHNIREDETLGRVGIDIGLRVQEFDDVDGSTTGGRDIRDERKHVSGLDSTKGYALIICDSVKDRDPVEIDSLTINDTKKLNIPNSSRETNNEPYQKIKAMTKKPIDWERE